MGKKKKAEPVPACMDLFSGMPHVEAECGRKEGHKGKHRDTWRQNDKMQTKLGRVKVEWKRLRDDDWAERGD